MIKPAPAVDERLLDISIPTLLEQTSSVTRASSKDGLREGDLPCYHNRETQTIPTVPSDLVHALQLTTHLEAQLKERTDSLTSALVDLTTSKLIVSELRRRVNRLEADLDGKGACKPLETAPISIGHASVGRLGSDIGELNDARDIVREIQKLVKN